jgi:hypothetical protein
VPANATAAAMMILASIATPFVHGSVGDKLNPRSLAAVNPNGAHSVHRPSAANPKFARFRGKRVCELRVQKRH